MVHAIEFHGRLRRSDGRPVDAGAYDLLFGLHGAIEGGARLWEEAVHGVPVAQDGHYHTVLGVGNALRPQLFDGSPRFLSVRIVRDGHADEEASDRVPVLGILVALGDELQRLGTRVGALETGAEPEAETRVKRRMVALRRRLRRLEGGGGALSPILARLGALEARLARIDGTDGRVARLEDELEDIVGPDGDIVDLTERLEALEKGLRRTGR